MFLFFFFISTVILNETKPFTKKNFLFQDIFGHCWNRYYWIINRGFLRTRIRFSIQIDNSSNCTSIFNARLVPPTAHVHKPKIIVIVPFPFLNLSSLDSHTKFFTSNFNYFLIHRKFSVLNISLLPFSRNDC